MANPEQGLLYKVHIDAPLLTGLLLLCALGLLVLYSAAEQQIDIVIRQSVRVGLGLLCMVLIAQIPLRTISFWAPWFYGLGLILLVLVLFFGTGRGAQRWLSLAGVTFQPSEILKLAVPVMVAWYFQDLASPPRFRSTFIALLLVAIPVILIAKQPDLGTSILVAASGCFVIFLFGIRWRLLLGGFVIVAGSIPLLWQHVLHEYQKKRVLTLLDPEKDPLGAGYHIIQSKIAIGSGGLYGKGWLNGTQSHLDFLPEHHTDFIFAVFCEEFGFLGVLGLLIVYAFVILRCLYLASLSQGTFARLLAGSLALTFFIYVLVNIGMVSGQLPVVGVPLPLISYGGTSMVTLMIGFGLIMSAYTHRKMMSR